MLPLLLAFALIQPAPVNRGSTATDWPGRLLTVPAAGGPAVLALLQPESELVALRLSVPVREASDAVSGAVAHQELVRDQLTLAVRRVGGRVELTHEPGFAVYAVTGPAAEFDALVAALRDAVGFAPSHLGEVGAAWRRAEDAVMARLETPGQLVRLRLWQRLESVPDVGGARAVAAGWEALESFWGTHYRPAQMRVVVVGGVTAEAARGAFRRWPSPQPRAAATVARSTRPEPVPQVMAPWVALGYRGEGSDAAALAVASRILAGRLAQTDLRGTSAELWLHDRAPTLVLVAASPTRSSGSSAAAAQALTQRLRRLLPEMADALSLAEVAAARHELRRELLLVSRTPDGMAAVLGGFADRTGDARAAGRMIADLERMDARTVAAVLRRLAEQEPLVAEVRP